MCIRDSAFFAILVTSQAGVSAALVPLSFEELTRGTRYIVTGRVVKMESYVAPYHGLGDWVFTDVTVRIDRAFKGNSSEAALKSGEVTFQVVGGTIGGVECICPEAASYALNERVIVFLRPVGTRLWNTGWQQGKYRLSADGASVLGGGRLPIGRRTPMRTIEDQIRRFEPQTREGQR